MKDRQNRSKKFHLKHVEGLALTMLDSVTMGIAMMNPEMEILWVNKTMQKWFPSIDIDNKPICYRSLFIPPREGICDDCPAIKAFSTGKTYSIESCAGSDGRIYNIITVPVRDLKGNVNYVVKTIEDITERKMAEDALRESERRYRTLFEDSRDAIYITTRSGRFIEVNQSALELFGYTRDEMIGLHTENIYANPADRRKFQREIEQKGSVRDYEVKLRKKDGTIMDCLLTSTLRRTNDGSILGYQGIIRDITEKRKMEAELIKSEKLESLGVLAGGIAHDFNNILTAILGNITLAKMYVEKEDEVFKRLVDAEKATLRAKELTHQLLTFSRGGAPIKKIISMDELLRECVALVLRGSKVKYRFSIPDDLWMAEVDEGQIGQVINNIVINADHAMPEGGTVTVRAENVTIRVEDSIPLREGNYIKISISDSGVGIPGEFLHKIFDPYFTTKQDGYGLGLTTAYSIIKKHDGHITVESEPGVGTTFHIYLPASPTKKVHRPTPSGKPITGKGKILLMEDEKKVSDIVIEMLSHLGYEARLARNGKEAVDLYRKEMLSEKPFDVVMLDLTIPGGEGGKEVIKKLREMDPDVKAIVSSGYSNDPIMGRFREYGFKDVIAKPYTLTELSRTLHRVLKGKR